jgi:hypothetical protein
MRRDTVYACSICPEVTSCTGFMKCELDWEVILPLLPSELFILPRIGSFGLTYSLFISFVDIGACSWSVLGMRGVCRVRGLLRKHTAAIARDQQWRYVGYVLLDPAHVCIRYHILRASSDPDSHQQTSLALRHLCRLF